VAVDGLFALYLALELYLCVGGVFPSSDDVVIFGVWAGHALLVLFAAWCFQNQHSLTLAGVVAFGMALLAAVRLLLVLLLLIWGFATDGPIEERLMILLNAALLLVVGCCELVGSSKGLQGVSDYRSSDHPQS
jgi:hypothetical protein